MDGGRWGQARRERQPDPQYEKAFAWWSSETIDASPDLNQSV